MKDNTDKDEELKPLKIEEALPVTAAGIESLKEAYSDSMSPHRKVFRWFARRPTAATRLAILASVLPPDVTDDQLLEFMAVGPKKELDGPIEDYVVSKEASKDDRNGSVEEHFGYQYPHRRLPNKKQFQSLHSKIVDNWGELPTVIDPTAGGGTIPFEASRYGLPSISNELNPVAWLLNKVILDYARTEGSLSDEIKPWANEIEEEVSNRLEEYFPDYNGVSANYYFRTYSTDCPSCGRRFPLSNRWWFNRSKRIAVVPQYDDERISYEVKELPEDSEFDASTGTVSGGDAECPHCGVVTERENLLEKFKSGNFEYELCAIKYTDKINGTKYHAPREVDFEAIRQAEEKVNSDLRLSTILQDERYLGYYDRAGPYGITRWRDLFSPRQLLGHATYLEVFEEYKQDILNEYPDRRAEAILTILSMIGTKQINHNARLVPIHARFGYVDNMLGNNNFSFQWHFGESNPLDGGKSYPKWESNILENYEKVVNYYPTDVESGSVDIRNGDAADLPLDDDSVQAVVIDPPYGDNIIYSEIADAFYVWLRKYLDDIFPDQFSAPATDKTNEAVENPSISDDMDDSSGGEAARMRYENKMSEIFSESYRVLEKGGVITIYFTDKEIRAWDALTMSIMNSGFTITATHTISSESPERIGVKGQSSADTSLLLTCRKPYSDASEPQSPTLWSDIREETQQVAKARASELLSSDTNLTKTDIIISTFGPTLRVFTENYPVVDKRDNQVRPKEALKEARKAVTEVLIREELGYELNRVDSLSKWYILSWLVYEREAIPHDEARQLGIGVGVDIDDMKSDTKIWGKSGEKLVLKGQKYRVRDYTALEAGEKRRERAYPVNPQDTSFDYIVDAVHAALNVMETKGSDFTWNWLSERDLQNNPEFIRVIESLLRVLPESHSDYSSLVNLVSGETGELLDIDVQSVISKKDEETTKTTIDDF
jgi:adenine-specific DNA methylase